MATHHPPLRRWEGPVAALWAGVLLVTWFLAHVGLTGALDAVARRGFYALRGVRTGGASVLFIAIDQNTVRE